MMRRRQFLPCFVLALVLTGTLGYGLHAQDPFGAGAAAPMPAPGAPAKTDAADEGGPPPTDDIVILAIRESKPTTPEALMQAVSQLLDYGAFDEARFYLAQLVAAKPTAGELAAVQRNFGTALFLRIAAEKRLAPLGAQVGQAVLRAAQQVNQDPVRLKKFAQQATDADATQREEALVELRNAGVAAVKPLLDIAGNRNLPEAQARARDALVALGESVVPPLLGVLEANNPELRIQAIAVLTRLNSSRVIPLLLRPALDSAEDERVQRIAQAALERLVGEVPSRSDAESLLARKAQEYFAGNAPLEADHNNLVTLWRWDAKQDAPVPHVYPVTPSAVTLPSVRFPDEASTPIEDVPASTIMAAMLARDLYALQPESADYRRLFLATHLEAGKSMSGLNSPLPTGPGTVHAMASLVAPEVLEDVLAWSIKNQHLPAAIAAAEVLGDSGSAELLLSASGAPRPLALALRHPDRRLRFAAADAILKFKSPTSFPGASYVAEALGYFAGSVGSRRVLVGNPIAEQASATAGILNTMGYDADIATFGRQVMKLALDNPDYEMIFLSDAIDDPDLDHVWQQLRKDPRTANTLVFFMAREENWLPLLEKAETDPLTHAMPYAHNREMMTFQVKQAFRHAGLKFVPYDERMRQARVALDHLARLTQDAEQGKYYDLLRQEPHVLRALTVPGLTVHAAPVLGGLGTHASQLALVDFASNANHDLTDRQAAVKGFATAVKNRGVLLTTHEIRDQYNRYNASESLDSNTQQFLASILDTIEQQAAAK
jgi:hypothetical protein